MAEVYPKESRNARMTTNTAVGTRRVRGHLKTARTTGKANKPVPEAEARTGSKTVRTTLVLPESLDQNLEAYALSTGSNKSEVIKEALIGYLRAKGLQPDKLPTISVTY